MEGDLAALALSPDVAVATFRTAVLCHFRLETPVSCAAMLRAAMNALPPDKPVVFFGIIETTSVPPSQAAREAFAKFFEDYSKRLAGAIITIRGTGFRAAMVRTIASGVLTLLPRFRVPFPKHIVGSLEEAAGHAYRISPELNPAALLAAFDALSQMAPSR
jgi:hypothetical protein